MPFFSHGSWMNSQTHPPGLILNSFVLQQQALRSNYEGSIDALTKTGAPLKIASGGKYGAGVRKRDGMNSSTPSRMNGTTSRYKSELCRTFAEQGTCKYGTKCQFAHGESDLRHVQRHAKFKTEKCINYHTLGVCNYGPRCHFIHNESSEEEALSIVTASCPSSIGSCGESLGTQSPRSTSESSSPGLLYENLSPVVDDYSSWGGAYSPPAFKFPANSQSCLDPRVKMCPLPLAYPYSFPTAEVDLFSQPFSYINDCIPHTSPRLPIFHHLSNCGKL